MEDGELNIFNCGSLVFLNILGLFTRASIYIIAQCNPIKESIIFDFRLSEWTQYLIIGGVAVNIHGYTRATGDLDIWYNPTKDNFRKLITSIKELGFDVTPIEKIENYDLKGFIRLPMDSFFVELLAIISGKLDFEETSEKAIQFDFSGVQVPVIGYDDLIQNKIMSRRAKDLEDIAQLERRYRPS